jgi:hypothetical protein
MITSLTGFFLKRINHPIDLAEAAGFGLDDWQKEFVSSDSKRLLLNCSRQIGKSTATAVLADYTALYSKKPTTTLLLSPSLRQSTELFRRCLEIYRALDKPIPAEAETLLRLELTNGSRIVSLPGKEATIRGIPAVDLMIIDEASRVEDALYKSVRPMLAVKGGRLVLLSSPFGCRGFFYEEYKRRAKWDYYEKNAHVCPRITQEFLDDELESMGPWWFDQEYMCKFQDAVDSTFRSEDIERLIKPDLQGWKVF